MKILIIQMKMIGDVLTSSILFEALRKEFPKAELHYLIYPHTIPVVENNPYIDKIIPFDKNQSLLNLTTRLKAEQYYAVVDVYANLKTAMITGISGAKFKISYDKSYTRPFSTHLFSRKINAKTIAGAAIEKRLRLLSPLSPNFPEEIKPKIFLKASEKEEAKNILSKDGINREEPLYMIGVLGSSEEKTYPLKYLSALLDTIVKETNANLLFNYIPSQKKQVEKLYKLCKPLTRKKIHLHIYGKSLREFMALTSQCDAMIGNEGGAVNMAKALDIPTFAIFAPPLSKENWNMYEDGQKHVSVHLKDYKSGLFREKNQKILHKESEELYNQFEPGLIKDQLLDFLKSNSK